MTHTKPRSLFTRLLSGVSALATAALALPALPAVTASAGEAYDLTVAGTTVETSNKSDVLGDGVFRYDPDENTLHISGSYTLPADSDDDIINNRISGLTVQVDGDSSLTAGGTQNAVIRTSADMTLTGPGTLTLTQNDSYDGIVVSSGTLTVAEAEVFITAKRYGIFGSLDSGKSPALTVERSNVHISAGHCGINAMTGGISWEDAFIAEPEQPAVSGGMLYDDYSSEAAYEVVFYAYYSLTIAGTEVTGENASDILGDGKFSYIPGTNTLNINGSYEYESGKMIYSKISGLTINTAQDATLNSGSYICIRLEADTTITGPGKLTLKGDMGIYAGGTLTLTLRDADVDALGTRYGITGDPYYETLYISNSSVHATGDCGAVCDFNSGISLWNAKITSPSDAKVIYSEEDCCDSIGTDYEGNPEKSTEVTIVPAEKYPLFIGGRQVSETNKNDVWGGSEFRYDPDSKTLFVNGEFRSDRQVINNVGIDGLVIYTMDDSTLESEQYDGMLLQKDTVITGPGKLTVYGDSAAIFIEGDSNLTVLNTSLTVSGQDGIVGDAYHAGGDSLTVIHSNLNLWGGNGGACYDLTGGWELIGCTETTDNVRKTDGFYNGSNYPADEVIVAANDDYLSYALDVCGIEVNEFNAADVLGNGVCAFDPATKTLAVKGNLSALAAYGIHYYDYDETLTVRIDADSSLKTLSSYDCIWLEGTGGIITGTGRLTIDGGDFGIYAGLGSLTFDGVQGEIHGKRVGICGNTGETLTLINSTLTVSSDEGGAIRYFRDVVLEGCEYLWGTFENGTAYNYEYGGDAEDDEPVIVGQEIAYHSFIKATGPEITAQPHNQTNVLGYTAKFSVTAKGDGLRYQWQMNSGSGWKNSGGEGATTNTLSIPITTGRNGNLYRCVVTNAYGGETISDEVMLKVKTSISAQPQSVTAPIGEVAKFSVTASGVGLTYQWQYNKGDGWVNSNGTGSKTNTLSINVAAGYNGYQYRCIINNTNNQPQTSSAATLTVKTAITAQPQSVTAAIGTAAKFTVTAKGTGLTYQWQYNKGAGWVNSNGTGSKTATLTINTSAAYNGYQYRCIITDANGATVTSSAATLTVKAAITGQPADVTAAIGTAAKFTVTAAGSGLTYQWQYNKGAGWVNSNGTGSKTATLTINTAAGYNGYQYRCIVTDSTGATATSNAATLKVKTTITTQPNGVNAVVGSTAKFTVAATGAGLKYQWQYNSGDGWKNSGSTGATTATLSIYAKTTYNGWKYRCVITDANGATTTSSVATLKIKAAISAQPASVSAAVGETAKFTVTAAGVDLTYQWQYNAGDGWKNSGASGAATATLAISAKTTYNAYQYHCIVTDGNGNKLTSDAATLTIKPAITTQPASVTATTGTTAKFTVAATGIGLTYQWQYNSGDGWKNSGASGATTATLSINAKATYNGWQYRCIVTDANGAKVISSTAKLTVK